MWLSGPNDNVAGTPTMNTAKLMINAIVGRLRLLLRVKFDTFSSNSEIEDVSAANKKSTKKIA